MEEKKKNNEKKGSRGGKRPGAGRKPNPNKKNTNIIFRINEDFRIKLQDFAQKEKMTVSDFLRFLVLQYERARTPQKEPEN